MASSPFHRHFLFKKNKIIRLSGFLKFTRRYYFYEGQKVKIWRLAAPPSCACRTHFTGSIIIRSAARRGVGPNHGELQGVHEILCFFLRMLESLPPLPRQHSASIGCTKNYQPIGVTVRLHCVEGFEGKGCSLNIVFFHNSHRNPSLANIAVRDLRSSQRNARLHSLLLAGNFLYNQ